MLGIVGDHHYSNGTLLAALCCNFIHFAILLGGRMRREEDKFVPKTTAKTFPDLRNLRQQLFQKHIWTLLEKVLCKHKTTVRL